MRMRGFPSPGLHTPRVELPTDRRAHLEIGFGRGDSLLTAARQDPSGFYVGVEAAHLYLEDVKRRAAELDNVVVVHGDGVKLLQSLAPESLQRVLVLFPDPWPRRKHAKRRIMTRPFGALVASRLAPRGSLVFKTDFADYFRTTVPLMAGEPLLRLALASSKPRHMRALAPQSAFERKYVAQGRPIHGALFVRADRPNGHLPGVC